MTSKDLERCIDAFILRERKSRWRILLDSPKGRKRLVATFAHSYDFDPRWAIHLGTTATAESVVAQLRAEGAGAAVHVLCEHCGYDGQTMPLQDAVREFFGQGFGTYLVCDPSHLAYFESEDVGGHYLLSR